MTQQERFLSKIEKTDGCWIWRGTVCPVKGYGKFSLGKKSEGDCNAHRYSYILHNGPIPTGQVVRHLCHNRVCVNPAHLCLGTQKDNHADSRAVGRHTHGSKNGRTGLTEAKVQCMRNLYWDFPVTFAQIGRAFDVSDQVTGNIIKRRYWKHV